MTELGLSFDEASHVYRWNGERVPSVTQVLWDFSPLSRLDRSVLAKAAQLGKDVHLACELDDLEELDEASVDPIVGGYLEAWRRFCSEFNYVPYMIEEQIYNSRLRYAGTFDRGGPIRKTGMPALVDIKSGSHCPTHGPQTCAYLKAASLGNRAIRGSVYLEESGRYTFERHYDDARDWATFLNALGFYRWKEEHFR